jgi:RNA polymerase sigma-70 factor (ECF subfamily)
VEVRRLEEHYAKFGDALVRFASTIVGPSDAEDVVSRVMVSMLQSRAPAPVDLGAYIYRSVANAARQHWRSMDRRSQREALSRPLERYEHHEFIPEVLAALAALSPQQRAAVHLTYWEDLTPPAVADRLGVSDGTVRRQLARARHKLAEVLHEIR